MTMKSNAKKMMTIAIAALGMVACSNNELFDEAAIEKDIKAAYAESFTKKYPEVSLNQSWDYSCKSFNYGLPGNDNNKARTRAGEDDYSFGDWYYVEKAAIDYMHQELPEGINNKSKGNPFVMTVPSEDFTIVPIYQGIASATWKLHVVVGNQDYSVWYKNDRIEIKDIGSQEWHSTVRPSWENGSEWWHELTFNSDGSNIHMPDGRVNLVTDVRSKEINFHNMPVGEPMYFYLKIHTTGNDEWHYMHDQYAEQSSLKGMMIALDIDKPTNLPADYKAMIVGCEDADQRDSDWDFNDVVFMIYGKEKPEVIDVTEGTPIVQTRSARYFIEDLGATDDFDFNDIVIDVEQSITSTPILTNGVVTGIKPGETKQKAIVRHLGGTLPFKLKIGNTELEEMGGQQTFQTSPDLEFDVTGWNPDTHNIRVQVQQKDNQGVYNNVVFPKAGEAPMIIAVDPSQDWMPERQSVPSEWFSVVD